MKKGAPSFFVLPGGAVEQALSGTLTGLELIDQTLERRFVLLDCHDQSLRRSGRLLIETEGRLLFFDNTGRSCAQNAKGQGRFVQDLPDGEVAQALVGFPQLRALIPITEGQMRQSDFVLRDDLQKTRLRGKVLTLSTGELQVTALYLQRLKGNHRAFAETRNALFADAGAATGVEALFDALMPGQLPYMAKPVVELTCNEPAAQAATEIIRTFLKVARANETGVIADLDTEFLHDYRVALRRIRSVISLFKGAYSEAQTTELKTCFSDLMAPTGRLRDLDVYLLEKDLFYNLLPISLHAGLDEMFSRFQAERKAELTRLRRRLRGASYANHMAHLEHLFEDATHLEPGPNAGLGAYDYACALIWKRYRKLCKLARSITPETPDAQIHELRIRCKKLRYLMEFFAPLFHKSAFKTIIKPLKKLQDNLGNFNDCSVQQVSLLAFAAQQDDVQLSLAAGGLITVLNQKQQAERNRIMANFQHFDSAEIRDLFRSLFHHKKG
ncbi:CHAD domain-containing protein [Ruegeria sp. HKCCD7255]|uniref:CHAD domain-containing protein n=1 Tax=Ruegeria sp. HKCCD7255 TaxID=2683004 RepID=UPI001488F725|nr:CHAD domain-containing protein [Ruegeria sp. HKCCD7255]